MIQKITITETAAGVVVAKASKTPRQRFMSALMKAASGDKGEAISEAFAAGDKDTLRTLMEELTDEVVSKARK